MEYSSIAQLAQRISENIAKVMIGQEQATELLLASILSGGHVLLEDVPGTGKTTLARALASSISAEFRRIQFTPDLLPSDVTGLRIYHQQQGNFEFVPGPVFTNILLADEINRATPRTQSALLECMEEKQVSEGGKTYPLPRPFLVIATQNPVESQGTFPLPEAQTDRFLMRLKLGYPKQEQAIALMNRFLRADPLAELKPVADCSELTQAAALCRTCHISEDVLRYMAALCEAARDEQSVLLGPSPRALLALMRACQALAAIRGRTYVIPDDVKELAIPVWAHRMLMRGYSEENSPQEFLKNLLAKIPVPTEETV